MRIQPFGLSAFFILSLIPFSTNLFAAEGCTVNELSGKASLIRPTGQAEAKTKDTLQKGDVVETGSSSRLDMSMNDLAGCRLLENTRVMVKSWKTEDMALSLEKGNVILNLDPLPEKSTFKLETPTAIAAVRGTQFWGRVMPTNKEGLMGTTFAVREGTVEITPLQSQQTFIVNKGQALFIPSDPTKTIERRALPDELKAMDQAPAIPTKAKA